MRFLQSNSQGRHEHRRARLQLHAWNRQTPTTPCSCCLLPRRSSTAMESLAPHDLVMSWPKCLEQQKQNQWKAPREKLAADPDQGLLGL